MPFAANLHETNGNPFLLSSRPTHENDANDLSYSEQIIQKNF